MENKSIGGEKVKVVRSQGVKKITCMCIDFTTKQDRNSVLESNGVPGTKVTHKWNRRVLEFKVSSNHKRQAVIKSDDMKFKAAILVGKLVGDDPL